MICLQEAQEDLDGGKVPSIIPVAEVTTKKLDSQQVQLINSMKRGVYKFDPAQNPAVVAGFREKPRQAYCQKGVHPEAPLAPFAKGAVRPTRPLETLSPSAPRTLDKKTYVFRTTPKSKTAQHIKHTVLRP